MTNMTSKEIELELKKLRQEEKKFKQEYAKLIKEKVSDKKSNPSKKFAKRQRGNRRGGRKRGKGRRVVNGDKVDKTFVPYLSAPQRLQQQRRDNSFKVKEIQHYSSRGPDLRNGLQTVVSDWKETVDGQVETIPVNVPMNPNSLVACAVNIISQAMVRGYVSASISGNNIYYPNAAFYYIIKILELQVLGLNIDLVDCPVWMAHLLRLLESGRSVNFKSGKISYSWKYTASTTFTPAISFPGINANTAVWNVYIPDPSGTTVQAYPVYVPAPSFTYTDQLGSAAFKDMCSFMASDDCKMWKMVNFQTFKSPMTNAMDAFAQNDVNWGQGLGAGGFGKYNKLEINSNFPLASVFNSPTNIARYFRHFRNSVGDACMFTGLLSTADNIRELRTKNPPMIKFIDIEQIIRVWGYWLQQLFTAYYHDNAVEQDEVNMGMTYQDFRIMIRSACMELFAETQHKVQSLINLANPSTTTDYLQPCVVNSNGVTPGSLLSNLLVPQLLRENLLALKGAALFGNYNPKTKKTDFSNPTWYLPCLGLYVQLQSTGADFKYLDRNDTLQLLFLPDSGPQISLIDGYSSNGYAGFGTGGKLKVLEQKYNQLISKLQPYSCPTSAFGKDCGINALRALGLTRWFSVNPSGVIRLYKETIADVEKMRKEDIGKRQMIDHTRMIHELDAMIKVKAPQYTTNALVVDAVTSQQALSSATYDNILSTWILPSFHYSPGDPNTGVDNQTSANGQSYYAEGYHLRVSIARQSTNEPPGDLWQLDAYNYANMMVWSRNGKTPELFKVLTQAEEAGRGGILAAMIGSFALDAANKYIPQIANKIKY